MGLNFRLHLCRSLAVSVFVHHLQPALLTRVKDKVKCNLCLAFARAILKYFAGDNKSTETILTQSQKMMGPDAKHTQ